MEVGRPGTGGEFRGGRPDRNVARPGGFGAGDCPIGEEIQSLRLRVCARGHDQVEAGEAPA
ncbi:hypothetical protein QFZ55_005991 [Streptomyces luteogriseus]|nr:hypothetical protein [Streptomyces luteogriseus]